MLTGFLICVAVKIARAAEARSRDALRERMRCDAKRALDSAAPAPESGQPHEETMQLFLKND